MATVYLAVDRRLDRDVALKVMHAAPGGGHVRLRLRRPVPARGPHRRPPHAPRARRRLRPGRRRRDQLPDDGVHRRREPAPAIGERGALTVGDALRIGESVLDALAAAHRVGLVHRDIKPENVLLATDGRVKLADFGLARAVTEVTSTTTGTVLGTVAYLAPELVVRGVSDARTDVYACGILIFEMLTGRQPFTGETPIQVAFQHVNNDVPAPSELVRLAPDRDRRRSSARSRRATPTTAPSTPPPRSRCCAARGPRSTTRRSRATPTSRRRSCSRPRPTPPRPTWTPSPTDGRRPRDTPTAVDEAPDPDQDETTLLETATAAAPRSPCRSASASAPPSSRPPTRRPPGGATVRAGSSCSRCSSAPARRRGLVVPAVWARRVHDGPDDHRAGRGRRRRRSSTTRGLERDADRGLRRDAPGRRGVHDRPRRRASRSARTAPSTFTVSKGPDYVHVPRRRGRRHAGRRRRGARAARPEPAYTDPAYSDTMRRTAR